MKMQWLHVTTVLSCFLAIFIKQSQGGAECQEKVADIVFLLDSSVSLWLREFGAQLAFVQDIVHSFTIGPNNIRVGVVTFSSDVRLDIRLNQYMDKKDLRLAVSKITRMESGTRTGDAIHFVHTSMFQPENGGRPWAAHILVLITDGYSYEPNKTQHEAAVARDKGIEIFAIGVKEAAYEGHTELYGIASEPKDMHVFNVDQYEKLSNIEEAVSTRACQHQGNWTRPETGDEEQTNPKTTAEKRCGGKPADVYIMLDSSNSIERVQFTEQLHFVAQLLHLFDLDADRTRVGVALFSDDVKEVVALQQCHTLDEIKAVLKDTFFLSGGTNTSGALEHLRTRVFPAARREVAHVAIILTDGQSKNSTLTAEEAKKLREMGVYVFAVGIGGQTDVTELMDIASDPNENFVFHVDNFASLRNIRELLAIKACDVGPSEDAGDQSEHNCVSEPTDVVFVYDSAAVNMVESDIISGFISDFVQNIENDDVVRYGLVRENCYKGDNINLQTGANAQAIEDFLQEPHQNGLSVLLQRVRLRGFLNVYDDTRARAQKLLVLFVGPKLQKISEVEKEIKRLQFQGVRLLVVAVGSDKDVKVLQPLQDLASAPLVWASDYDSLSTLTGQLVNRFCEVARQRPVAV